MYNLPNMLSNEYLISAMTVLPEYDSSIKNESQPVRLMMLSDLYRIYIPSQMSTEIYSKFYLALLRSLQKKNTKEAIIQQNENYKAIKQLEYNSILGGSDSFTIIGTSGIGKSSAIDRAINLIGSKIIETDNPYRKIIPCIVVQCPFDSSVKGLLLEILRKVDESLNTNYYQNALKARATTDMLIGSISQVALNHIGLLIVDEIQNVVNSKNGKNLIGMLTQLINNSGISICMVGTPESLPFFEQAMQLARRSLGLQYNRLEYDDYFCNFCETLFSYQYVKYHTDITTQIIEWLYDHSAGVISIVVSLVHDAQEIAILNGKEILSIETLNEAYQKRLTLLHDYINPTVKKARYKKIENILNYNKSTQNEIKNEQSFTIKELVDKSKKENLNTLDFLKDYITIEVVEVC